MESINKIDYKIRNLNPRSVTLFPSRAQIRMKLLDTYSKTWDRKKGPSIAEESLQTYKEQRSRIHGDYMAGFAQQRDREERKKEMERLWIECQKFWPKYCYTVKITLEMNPDTMFHSRRTSLSSSTTQQPPDANPAKATHTKNAEAVTPHPQCDLVLSYVTSAAYWVPSYDLQLWTTTAMGTLSFDTELHNWTSETWMNSKVVLSTSQVMFSGLDDAMPTLEPWYVSLVQGPPPYGHGRVLEEIARSRDEVRSAKEALGKQKLDRAHNKSRRESGHVWGSGRGGAVAV
ncbi:hypothetical protein E4U58_003536 [Claviceps cyperi]|nr:hypothetical protein E4U58_003536 [Claviceps cyperi]